MIPRVLLVGIVGASASHTDRFPDGSRSVTEDSGYTYQAANDPSLDQAVADGLSSVGLNRPIDVVVGVAETTAEMITKRAAEMLGCVCQHLTGGEEFDLQLMLEDATSQWNKWSD